MTTLNKLLEYGRQPLTGDVKLPGGNPVRSTLFPRLRSIEVGTLVGRVIVRQGEGGVKVYGPEALANRLTIGLRGSALAIDGEVPVTGGRLAKGVSRDARVTGGRVEFTWTAIDLTRALTVVISTPNPEVPLTVDGLIGAIGAEGVTTLTMKTLIGHAQILKAGDVTGHLYEGGNLNVGMVLGKTDISAYNGATVTTGPMKRAARLTAAGGTIIAKSVGGELTAIFVRVPRSERSVVEVEEGDTPQVVATMFGGTFTHKGLITRSFTYKGALGHANVNVDTKHNGRVVDGNKGGSLKVNGEVVKRHLLDG